MEARARGSDCCARLMAVQGLLRARLCVAAVGSSGNGRQGTGYARGSCSGGRAHQRTWAWALNGSRQGRLEGGGGGRNE